VPDDDRIYRWTLTLWKSTTPKKAFVAVSHEFTSHTKTVEATFELLWEVGWCCVRKNDQGKVIPAADFEVRLSQGGL
jgi:hypothetical protein